MARGFKLDKIQKHFDEDTNMTTKQRKAAKEIWKSWPTSFAQLERDGEYSRQHYQDVYYKFFGPEEGDLTFKQIKEEYDPLDEYLKDVRGHVPEEVQEAYDKGYDKGFEAGKLKGLQIGYHGGVKEGYKLRQQSEDEMEDEDRQEIDPNFDGPSSEMALHSLGSDFSGSRAENR